MFIDQGWLSSSDQSETNQRIIYSVQFENFSKLKASNFVNEMKLVTCSVWFYHLSKFSNQSYTKINFILDGSKSKDLMPT